MGRGWEPAALRHGPDALACHQSGSVVEPWASAGTEELKRTGRWQPERLKGWKKLGHLCARGSSQRSWPESWISTRGENSTRLLERIFGCRTRRSLSSKAPHQDASRGGCLHPSKDRRILATASCPARPSHPRIPLGWRKDIHPSMNLQPRLGLRW